jgi:hypothetical protein
VLDLHPFVCGTVIGQLVYEPKKRNSIKSLTTHPLSWHLPAYVQVHSTLLYIEPPYITTLNSTTLLTLSILWSQHQQWWCI